jgi:acyl carrier protein
MTSDSNAIQFLTEWVERRSTIRPTPEDDIFETCGLDSLDFAELLADAQEIIGLKIQPENVLDWVDIRTLKGLVAIARLSQN